MTAFTFATEPEPPKTAGLRPSQERSRSDDLHAPFAQLGVVREMLSTLDSLTTAGQQYIMRKIVSFMEDQAGRVRLGLSVRNDRTFSDLLRDLKRGSEDAWPDPGHFTRSAENLIVLLGALA